MKLRNQVLTLSLATLLVPWFGWKLVQELEQFLRAGVEGNLLASAQVLASALPVEHQATLAFERSHVLPLRALEERPVIDGYADDWPEAESAVAFSSRDSDPWFEVLAGLYRDQVFLLCRVRDDTPVRELPPPSTMDVSERLSDGIVLYLRGPRGLSHFRIQTAAPGPLLLSSQVEGAGQIEGYWQDRAQGYQVELSLPPGTRALDLSIGAVDVSPARGGQQRVREAGTTKGGRPDYWLRPTPPYAGLSAWLEAVTPADTRAWVVDEAGWVVAGTAPAQSGPARELTWLERVIYRVVAGERTELHEGRPTSMVRFEEPFVTAALQGEEGRHWGQDPEDAVVRSAVAVPLALDGRTRGAVVLEATTDGLLLVTNRALGRLLLATVLVTLVLTAGLWLFATRLSRRVRRLGSAVSRAMDDTAHPRDLPLTGDRDELGELARNNARLLRAVADYTSYLQKLAGRLSHELKTPLAITRSSLDNLASHDLDPEGRRYLARAREGLDRQAAIVRAMSEASRLEAAVKSADWEQADIAELLRNSVEAYRAVHPGRRIVLDVPEDGRRFRCAADLLAQALDKLVDNAVGLTGENDEIDVGLRYRNGACVITVRNTGSRLPEVLHDQLFDSLVSLREGGDAGRHLGLGLHIVRLVAEAHGGTAHARNLPGDAGVEFRIELPGHS